MVVVVEKCAADLVMRTASAVSVIWIANRTAFFLHSLVGRPRCCLCCTGAQAVQLVCSWAKHWVVCGRLSVCAVVRHRSRRRRHAVFWVKEKECHPL